jgi:enoyl-CoA hydratase/carnithine racemase
VAKGPIAVNRALTAINASLQTSLDEGLNIEAELFGEVCGSRDAKEGIQAFLDKRKPVFKGK